jgi:hypothetical protein
MTIWEQWRDRRPRMSGGLTVGTRYGRVSGNAGLCWSTEPAPLSRQQRKLPMACRRFYFDPSASDRRPLHSEARMSDTDNVLPISRRRLSTRLDEKITFLGRINPREVANIELLVNYRLEVCQQREQAAINAPTKGGRY